MLLLPFVDISGTIPSTFIPMGLRFPLMEQDPEGTPEPGTSGGRDVHAGLWDIMALSGLAVTGILLIILGVWKGKRREKEDENITDGN